MPARRDPDQGFTLMEVVVAMTIFGIFVAAALGILLRTTEMARDTNQRNVATNLALQQVEAARSMDVMDIPDGRVTTTQTVGGQPFTIAQTSKFVSSGAASSTCTGSGNTLAYKLVTVTVTWPDMGSIRPVRTDTLKAVGLGSDIADASRGTLAVGVVGATNAPIADIPLTLMPGNKTVTTGEDGCVIFTTLAPGTYTVSTATTGYVGITNANAVTLGSLGVTAGAIARGTLYYDTARNVNVAFDGSASAAVPSNLKLLLGNTYQASAVFPACVGSNPTTGCVTAVPGTAKSLFPENYSVKAGTCTETTSSSATVDLKPLSANNSTVTLPMGKPVVNVKLGTVSQAGRTVTFTHVAGCTEVYTMTTVAGGSAVTLPYGSWVVTVPSMSGATQTVALSGTNKNPAIDLTVSS